MLFGMVLIIAGVLVAAYGLLPRNLDILEKLGVIDVIVVEASAQMIDLYLHDQCLLLLRTRLELER